MNSERTFGWHSCAQDEFAAFLGEVDQSLRPSDWPLAAECERNVLIYSGVDVAAAVGTRSESALKEEWAAALSIGSGIVVVRNVIADHRTIDGATGIFSGLIEAQRAQGRVSGDHFAKPGANDRVWNALQKHCLADAENFAHYYACPALAMISEAWLGPGYQVTAQVNRVNPGGTAQVGHRDYHLGFMLPDQARAFPPLAHQLSPILTLQGAIAHCDMPVESGPTKYLPFSHRFAAGYCVFAESAYQEYFEEHHVQLALNKGDAVFFNPAVMHAAGANTSGDIYRLANLLQISSAFARSLENVDRIVMANTVYPVLLAALDDQSLSPAEVDFVIAASAEGYAFPTNLDLDPPVDGLAPDSQATFMRNALRKRWPAAEFSRALAAMQAKRAPA